MSNKPIKVSFLESYLKSAFPSFLFNYAEHEIKKPYDEYIQKVAGEIYFKFILEKEIQPNEQNPNT